MSRLQANTSAECPEPTHPPEYGLYVIFHGVFAFYETPGSDIVDVFVAKSEEYDCMAGSFLTEHAIRGPKGVVFLTGADSAPCANRGNTMLGHEYAISVPRAIPPSPDYGTHIRVPRPSRIYWDMIVDGVRVDFALQETKTQSWAHVPIFAYKTNGKPISLTGRDFLWAPCEDEPSPITLHIWASGDMPWDGGGPKAAAELLGERIEITLPPDFRCYRHEHPPGLADRKHEYEWRLTERFLLLQRLSTALRGRGIDDRSPIEIVPTQTIFRPAACGPVVGGRDKHQLP